MMKIIFLETILSAHQIDHGFETFVLLSNLIFIISNSLNYDWFQDLIKSVLKERENMMIKKRNLSINIDLRIAEIFKSSTIVAGKLKLSLTFIVSNGRINYLLRKKLLCDIKRKRSSSNRSRNCIEYHSFNEKGDWRIKIWAFWKGQAIGLMQKRHRYIEQSIWDEINWY